MSNLTQVILGLLGSIAITTGMVFALVMTQDPTWIIGITFCGCCCIIQAVNIMKTPWNF